jgi:hypothetical protein
MKKLGNVLIAGLSIIWTSCNHGQTKSVVSAICTNDSVQNDSLAQVSDDKYEYQDQRELNELHANLMIEYNDSIEKGFRTLQSTLPQYKEYFDKEKKAWMTYQEAVRIVASCEDHGSSTSMFIDDVLSQGIKLRETSFRHLLYHFRGEEVSFSKTTFTLAMIKDAYSAFIKAVGENEYNDNKLQYQKAIRNEQSYWDKWMETRETISNKLDKDIRIYYDECTNLVRRTKLLQVKNQNQALGLTGHEPLDCVLPDDCSDNALLKYPGFAKVWAKHCENTDWYPTFE